MSGRMDKNPTGWAPGQPRQTPRPTAPAARTGGSGMPGVAAPHDPKHVARTVYQFGSGEGSAGSRPAMKDPAYVRHVDQRVDAGRRIGTKPEAGHTMGAGAQPLGSRNAKVRGK